MKKAYLYLVFAFQGLCAMSFAQNHTTPYSKGFCDSLNGAVLASKGNFASIRGNNEIGIDGLYDVPYYTYQSKLHIPGSVVTYIMSNAEWTNIEKHIEVFVCNYLMSPDSELASKVFEKLNAEVWYCIKAKNMKAIAHSYKSGDGTSVIRDVVYEVNKRKKQTGQYGNIIVSFEKRHHYDSHIIEGYVVYLKISKN